MNEASPKEMQLSLEHHFSTPLGKYQGALFAESNNEVRFVL
jgi:hypothetical protein